MILKAFSRERLVLPDRIELSTSPLPMECSTTELRQRARIRESAKRPRQGAPILATRPEGAQAREMACEVFKNGHIRSGVAPAAFNRLRCGPIRFPISPPSAASALIGRTMTSNSGISPVSPNLVRSTPLSCHLPILAENSSAASWDPAIAPRGRETQYAPTTGSPAGRDRRTPQAMPAVQGPLRQRRQRVVFAHRSISPMTLFRQRCIRTGRR